MMRSVQLSIAFGSRRCAAALTCWYPNAPLHLLRWAERVEYLLALLFGEAAEIELIMIAQEHSPLRRGRSRPRGIKRLDQRLAIGRSQRVEQSLIDLKVEHHMHAIAVVPEEIFVIFGHDIGLPKKNGVTLTPLKEIAHF